VKVGPAALDEVYTCFQKDSACFAMSLHDAVTAVFVGSIDEAAAVRSRPCCPGLAEDCFHAGALEDPLLPTNIV